MKAKDIIDRIKAKAASVKRKPSRVVCVATVVVVLVAMTELLFGFGLPAANRIATHVVTLDKTSRETSVQGVVEASEVATIYAPATGIVESVFLRSGDIIRSSDIVLVLETTQAKESLTKYETELESLRNAIRPAMSNATPQPVTAAISGRVVALNASRGASMSDGVVAVIAENGYLYIELEPTIADQAYDGVWIESDDYTVAGEVADVGGGVFVMTDDASLSVNDEVTVKDASDGVLVIGTLKPYNPSIIFGVSGIVGDVMTSVGSIVREGDTLFTLSEPVTLAGYEDDLQALETVTAKIAGLERTINASTLRSPTDGLVSGIAAKKGDAVKEGDPICIVTDPDKRQVMFRLDGEEYNIKAGDEVSLSVESVDEPVIGVVDTLGAAFDDEGEYRVARVSFAFQEGIAIGKPATMTAATRQESESIWIPNEAIITDGDDAYVIRALPESSMSFAQKHFNGPIGRLFTSDESDLIERSKDNLITLVELGAARDGFVEVLGGLEPDDVIIANVGEI